MSTNQNNNSENDQNKAEEPDAAYGEKQIVFFDSFEEMDEYEAKERATLSHDERLEHVEILRRHVFSNCLRADGSWPPISRVFEIMEPYTNDTGK